MRSSEGRDSREAWRGKEIGEKGQLLRGGIGGEGRERREREERKESEGKGSGGEGRHLSYPPLQILCEDINI